MLFYNAHNIDHEKLGFSVHVLVYDNCEFFK